jgi:SpoIIAA-like
MPLEVMELIRGVVSVKIIGELKKSDLDQMRAAILQGIKQWSRIRLHVIVENFTGCEASADGNDVQVLEEHGRNIEKVATLGEEQWRNGSAHLSVRPFSRRPLSIIRPSTVPGQSLGSQKGYDRCATSRVCELSFA